MVVIVDCCYSGSAKISKGSEDDTAKIGRLILEEKSRKLPEGQGKYILSSSQSHQEAYALTTGEHSIFTYYLLKVLSGNSESIDSEEYVTPQSLGNYIIREITWGVNPEEAVLDGVFTLRTREDSSRLRARLASGPKHCSSSVAALRVRRLPLSVANWVCRPSRRWTPPRPRHRRRRTIKPGKKRNQRKQRQEKRWLAPRAHYFRTGRWDWHKHWQNYRTH